MASVNTFVGSRHILDAAIVASEMVDKVVGSRKAGILCKLDMKKTYDMLIGSLLITCWSDEFWIEMERVDEGVYNDNFFCCDD